MYTITTSSPKNMMKRTCVCEGWDMTRQSLWKSRGRGVLTIVNIARGKRWAFRRRSPRRFAADPKHWEDIDGLISESKCQQPAAIQQLREFYVGAIVSYEFFSFLTNTYLLTQGMSTAHCANTLVRYIREGFVSSNFMMSLVIKTLGTWSLSSTIVEQQKQSRYKRLSVSRQPAVITVVRYIWSPALTRNNRFPSHHGPLEEAESHSDRT